MVRALCGRENYMERKRGGEGEEQGNEKWQEKK